MSIFEAAIGWVAPPQCISCGVEGSTLCLACSTSEIIAFGQHCWLCNAASPLSRTCVSCRLNSPRHVWISTNYSGAASQLIKAYKFGHLRVASDDLSKFMVDTLLDFIGSDELKRLNYLVVPIPTATSRLRHRGFGHSELLADKIAKRIALKASNCLGRLGQSRQLGSKRADRLKLPEDKYFVRRPDVAFGRNILLIDDVVTTGATVKEATKWLRPAGARRIDSLIFAKKL